jgi:(4S)-4-hydroxy-5-phosphonooxypentane-2,3-dione isomerase
MHIVHVHVHVKPENVAAFRDAVVKNARGSVQEPGCTRFDVVQSADDPTWFVLVEIYRDEAASAAHKETPHYKEWRDTVADMMAAPRKGQRYHAVFPADADGK